MIIILMGVTGTGKTTAGRKLAASLGWEFFDAGRFSFCGERRENEERCALG
jgi:gluconate kinase